VEVVIAAVTVVVAVVATILAAVTILIFLVVVYIDSVGASNGNLPQVGITGDQVTKVTKKET
jgi:hypothetical protein